MSKWFQANWHILNPTKTQVLKFTSGKLRNALYLTYADHLPLEVETIQFLGLQWDNQIACKNHIQLLLRKLSSACFLMGQLHYILTLRRLMSYIYGAPILDVSRSHTTQHSR